jgi:signal transduction histidine kinase
MPDDRRHIRPLRNAMRLAFAFLAMGIFCAVALGTVSLSDGGRAMAVDRTLEIQAALAVLLILAVATGAALLEVRRRALLIAEEKAALPAELRVGRPEEIAAPSFETSVEPSDAHSVEPRDFAAELHTLGAEVRRQVGDVSHEMRTPLAIIAGSVNSVRRALPQGIEKGRRSIDLIALSCERLVDILDLHRERTSDIIDSFLGSEVSIDVGAFVQDFIAHAHIAPTIVFAHPLEALHARTQTGGLKELLHHLLVRTDGNQQSPRVKVSLQDRGEQVLIVVEYDNEAATPARKPATNLQGVEFALRGRRLELSLMGATLHRTLDAQGNMTVTVALPAEVVA